jgi:hypothetical protein
MEKLTTSDLLSMAAIATVATVVWYCFGTVLAPILSTLFLIAVLYIWLSGVWDFLNRY